MRYSAEHKAEIHQKIVHDASHRIRTEGITATAVSSVMRDAGLTHGGFYKHFESKDDLLKESLNAAFNEIIERLTQAAEQAKPKAAWKAIVKTYLTLEYCDHIEYGCPMPALAPELARADKSIRRKASLELANYKNSMLPFMPGHHDADKEQAFFAIFSTMIGAIEIARLMPGPAAKEKVLASAKDLLLRSF